MKRWIALPMVLILLPWSDVWDVNYFLYQYPNLAFFVKNSYLRGMISGLGIINVMLAVQSFRNRTAPVAART